MSIPKTGNYLIEALMKGGLSIELSKNKTPNAEA